jgi:dienelactone hydrolase
VNLASAGGARPLIIFAGGTAHSTDENVALWEVLASHGYVVAALPTVAVGANAEGAYLPDDALGLETVTRDIEAVLAYARRRPDVDPVRVAVVGFSFGGAAGVAAAARHAGIRAVVGLDASFIAARHLPMIRSAPLFDVRRLAVPLLEFHRADSATVDLSLVEAARGRARFSIELSGLDHVDFNSYILLYGPLLPRGTRPVRDSALFVKAATYRAMVETTRLFLDDALGRVPVDSSALAAALRGEGAVWADVPRATIRARRWPPAD